jgi:hypothetical protein
MLTISSEAWKTDEELREIRHFNGPSSTSNRLSEIVCQLDY